MEGSIEVRLNKRIGVTRGYAGEEESTIFYRSRWSKWRVRLRAATTAAVIVFETFIGARRSAGRKNWLRRITVSPV